MGWASLAGRARDLSFWMDLTMHVTIINAFMMLSWASLGYDFAFDEMLGYYLVPPNYSVINFILE